MVKRVFLCSNNDVIRLGMPPGDVPHTVLVIVSSCPSANHATLVGWFDCRCVLYYPGTPSNIPHPTEVSHMWTKPAYTDLRLGFEVTLYISNR